MEYIMIKNNYFPLTLLAAALLGGCNTTEVKPNSALTEAHKHYDNAQSNPNITSLAALEMKQASDTLAKADEAASKYQGAANIDHLAYIANQQVTIAEETALRKTAEFAVTNAGAKRNEIRLEARTAEVDTARQDAKVSRQETLSANQDAELSKQQAESANKDLGVAVMIANQQAADLEVANANAQRDKELLAKQQKQLDELNAKKTERGMVITLGDVLFRTDQAELEAGGVHNVQKLADFLKKYPQQKVLIEGYTDSRGSDSHNQALSERRASAVQQALTGMGISADRITMHGYGEKYPVASNATAANQQLNRRVEIILSDANGKIIQR
jgi:outer membrane protein OmpA-like peptidoglycan-associated protein